MRDNLAGDDAVPNMPQILLDAPILRRPVQGQRARSPNCYLCFNGSLVHNVTVRQSKVGQELFRLFPILFLLRIIGAA